VAERRRRPRKLLAVTEVFLDPSDPDFQTFEEATRKALPHWFKLLDELNIKPASPADGADLARADAQATLAS
jgi:hypothetical protein